MTRIAQAHITRDTHVNHIRTVPSDRGAMKTVRAVARTTFCAHASVLCLCAVPKIAFRVLDARIAKLARAWHGGRIHLI